MKTIAILTVTLAGFLWAGQAQAHDPWQHYRGGNWGTGYRGFHNHGWSNRGHSHWHNTGHYDYVPGGFVPHRNHWHYVPGGFRWHDTSHMHYHRGHHHRH